MSAEMVTGYVATPLLTVEDILTVSTMPMAGLPHWFRSTIMPGLM